MRSSIPKARNRPEHTLIRSRSVRALAVAARLEAARLERGHDSEAPPGEQPGRAEHRPPRRTPDPA